MKVTSRMNNTERFLITQFLGYNVIGKLGEMTIE